MTILGDTIVTMMVCLLAVCVIILAVWLLFKILHICFSTRYIFVMHNIVLFQRALLVLTYFQSYVLYFLYFVYSLC